jgi:AcrR family transcriptional regulator
MNSVQFGATWGDREGRRRDILRAARQLLGEVGYAELSMRALARRARISAGTLYLYFSTKEEIFLNIYSERMEELRLEAKTIAAEVETLDQLIRRFAEGYRRFYGELGRYLNPVAMMADQDAVARLPMDLVERLRSQVLSIFLEIAQRMDELAKREGLELIDPPRAVPFMWMTLAGLADSFTGPRAGAQPFEWEPMVEFGAKTLVRGLTEKKTRRKRR